MIKHITLLVICLFSYAVASAQLDTNPSVFKYSNTIYGTAALGGLWGTFNLNYERQLYVNKTKLFKSVGIRAGGGYWSTWGSTGPHFILTPTFLSGTGKHHFESSIGVTALYDKLSYDISVSNYNYVVGTGNLDNEVPPSIFDYIGIYPAGTLGYRFQKPEGRFIFRTGAGFPDVVYVSFGVVF